MEREEWYRLRNDRINRIQGVNLVTYTETSVGVVINPQYVSTFSVQIMAYMSINMLSRWCQSFTIDSPDNISCVIPGFENRPLTEVLGEIAEANDPYGNFTFRNVSESKYDIVLQIGGLRSNQNSIWIDSEGWLAGIGQNEQKLQKNFVRGSKNPVGPSFAACLGVSEVFKRFLDNYEVNENPIWYSFYDFQSNSSPESLKNPYFPEVLDIGNIFQIGCGAVGSSLDLLLSFLDVRGNINLIDFDTVSVQNTASSMLFTAEDSFQENDKVLVCESILDTVKGLNIMPQKKDYGTFIKENNLLQIYPDIILCLANEHNIWSTIQHNFPPLVLHATTSPNWGINLGRHIPIKDWCIVCRFGISEYETTPVCSEAQIKPIEEEEGILGILPFLSSAAATLILSEVIKSTMDDYILRKENFFQFAFQEEGSEFLGMIMPRKDECPICKNQSKEDYAKLIDLMNKSI